MLLSGSQIWGLLRRLTSARRHPSLSGGVIGRFGIDPGLVASLLDLFPERGARLQIVYEEFGCCKCGFAMGRRSHNQDYIFARYDASVSMNHGDTEQWPPLPRFAHVTLDLGLCHTGIVFERQSCDRLTILESPADSGERHDCPDIGTPMRQRRRFRRGVKRLALQPHSSVHGRNLTRWRGSGYPPVIGGKNAISLASLIAASARTWR